MGDTKKNVDISVFQKAKKRLEIEKKPHEKKVIVNAGLLKAGKSTLFNALAGRRTFASDVVRATTENGKIELEQYFLVDTPGLDAEDKDTQTALEGYKMADAIMFVHNIQEGELNQIEIDSIRQICNLFDSDKDFFENTLLVLTHKDQIEVPGEDIVKCIEGQCKTIFGNRFNGCFCVDSVGYLKGVEEHKELLKQESGIPELLQVIETNVLQAASLQAAQFEKNKKQLLTEMEEALAALQKKMPKEEASLVPDMQGAEKEIKQISSEAIKTIQERNVELSRAHSSYKWLGHAKNYQEYDSEYSAKSDGKAAISDAINKIARQCKRDALSIVEQAGTYINLAGVPKGIVDEFSEAYEKMRCCAQRVGMTFHSNFTVTLRDPAKAGAKNTEKTGSSYYSSYTKTSELEKAKEELGYARDHAKYIDTGSFSSASYYAESYSSNLWIDFDTREKMVTGLFGKTGWKSVRVYSYDASGAIDDVSSDAVEKITDIVDEALEAVRPAFREIKEDLEKQFVDLTNKILAEISGQLESQRKQEQEYQQKKNAAQKEITELESCMRAVEAVRW